MAFADIQFTDEGILSAAHGNSAVIITAFVVLTLTGSGLGLLALVPFFARKPTRVATTWLFAALAGQGAIVGVLKLAVSRPRPCAALAWCAALGGSCPTSGSMPSGHAAGAFTFAAFVAIRSPKWAAPAIFWAVLVACSRCVLGMHYPTDVLAGAVLGSVVGVAFGVVSRRRALTQATEARPSEARA
jgi:undecaprenyl-diphosphatase